MQFNATPMPISPQPTLSQFLLGAPGHIVYYPRNLTTASVLDQVDAMFGEHGLEKREEEGVWVFGFSCRDIFLVEDVM
jgi:hypothetical protein